LQFVECVGPHSDGEKEGGESDDETNRVDWAHEARADHHEREVHEGVGRV
jgi:hypothetical protein